MTRLLIGLLLSTCVLCAICQTQNQQGYWVTNEAKVSTDLTFHAREFIMFTNENFNLNITNLLSVSSDMLIGGYNNPLMKSRGTNYNEWDVCSTNMTFISTNKPTVTKSNDVWVITFKPEAVIKTNLAPVPLSDIPPTNMDELISWAEKKRIETNDKIFLDGVRQGVRIGAGFGFKLIFITHSSEPAYYTTAREVMKDASDIFEKEYFDFTNSPAK